MPLGSDGSGIVGLRTGELRFVVGAGGGPYEAKASIPANQYAGSHRAILKNKCPHGAAVVGHEKGPHQRFRW